MQFVFDRAAAGRGGGRQVLRTIPLLNQSAATWRSRPRNATATLPVQTSGTTVGVRPSSVTFRLEQRRLSSARLGHASYTRRQYRFLPGFRNSVLWKENFFSWRIMTAYLQSFGPNRGMIRIIEIFAGTAFQLAGVPAESVKLDWLVRYLCFNCTKFDQISQPSESKNQCILDFSIIRGF